MSLTFSAGTILTPRLTQKLAALLDTYLYPTENTPLIGQVAVTCLTEE